VRPRGLMHVSNINMGLRTQLCNPSFNIELSARPVQTRLLSKLELACKLVHDGWKLHATDDVLKPHRRKSALVFLESFYDKSKLYLEVLNNVSDVFKKTGKLLAVSHYCTHSYYAALFDMRGWTADQRGRLIPK
jgi:hypothetical protein